MVSLSVVVPCYNEAEGILQLKEKLLPILDQINVKYSVELVFIDDGSCDNTYSMLLQAFSERPNTHILRHPKNLNLGAAIRTGVRESHGEWIAMLDSDCTYAPALLESMLCQMEQGADFVTVSPYHPQGRVEGVPAYRLFLSRALTAIYRFILRKKFYTFTALMRIYRRSIYPKIVSPLDDFSCLAEMMLKALKQNLHVTEVPAVLAVRQFGESKMKTARVIRAHLRLLARLVFIPSSFCR